MANLFKPTYTKTDPETGEKVRKKTRKWYAQYHDADGILRRVPLCTDKTAAQAKLTELVRKVERQQAGLVDPAAEELGKSVESHVKDYKRHLKAKGRSETHVSETIRLITKVTKECGCIVLADLHSADDDLEEYLADRLESGVAYRTVNADLVAVRSFCRWLLERKRMHHDPTSSLSRLNEEEDRRLERRPLSDKESQKLIETTYRSERVFRHLSGHDRAMLYLVAQRTGLRRGELRSLTKESFNLNSTPPAVTVAARHSKRRKRDTLPLSKEAADLLATYLADRPEGKVWPGSWWRKSANMLRMDLNEAGIPVKDDAGRVVDFHGQRATFITSLARASVSPTLTQRLARHSDINLTMNKYTQLQNEDLIVGIDKLPVLDPQRCEVSSPSPIVENDVDADLKKVVLAWPKLANEVRKAIVVLVGSSE